MTKRGKERYWEEPGYIPKPYHSRPEASCYRLRKIVTSNKCGDVFGITIPISVGSKYLNCFFTIEESGTCIILSSGIKI
jgi:hypothetical protein